MTLTRNTDNSVLNKDKAIKNAKTEINAIEWYVPHYRGSISKQAILSKQTLSRTPTELQYVRRSVFMKELITQSLWTFKLGNQEGLNVPIYRQESPNLNNGTFFRPPVTSAQFVIGTEKYPDPPFLLYYDDDDYSQGYGQFKEAFRALTKGDILKPYISDNDFSITNNNIDIGYNLYVFDIRHLKNLESTQPNKVELF